MATRSLTDYLSTGLLTHIKMGYSSITYDSNTLSISNTYTNGSIELSTDGTGELLYNGFPLLTAENLVVYDTPIDDATTIPISANWAYDHENATDPHSNYIKKIGTSNIGQLTTISGTVNVFSSEVVLGAGGTHFLSEISTGATLLINGYYVVVSYVSADDSLQLHSPGYPTTPYPTDVPVQVIDSLTQLNSVYTYENLFHMEGGSVFLNTKLSTSEIATKKQANSILIGVRAGRDLIRNSAHNIAVGSYAGEKFYQSGHCIAIGSSAGKYMVNGFYNIGIGASACSGSDAAAYSITGRHNTGLGVYSLGRLTSGENNIGIGEEALYGANVGGLTGEGNIGLGEEAGHYIYSGNHNILLGKYAGRTIETGYGNIALGEEALVGPDTYGNEITGYHNIAIGQYAGRFLVAGIYNIFLGQNAGSNVVSGSSNILIGQNAADTLSIGSDNILIGKQIDVLTNNATSVMSIANTIYATGGFSTGTTVSSANIGIGTGYNIDEKLHVEDSTTAATYIKVENSNAADTAVGLKLLNTYNTSTLWTIENTVAGDLNLYTGGSGEFQVNGSPISMTVHDSPVDAATTIPISSNWAYDHINTVTDPHTQYLLNNADDTTTGTLTIGGQLIVNSHGTTGSFIANVGYDTTGLNGPDNIIIGDQCGTARTTASAYNIILGTNNVNGAVNDYIGDYSIIIGHNIGNNFSGAAHRNILMGLDTGQSITGIDDTVMIGSYVGQKTPGTGSVLIGKGAGQYTTGTTNTIIGYNSGVGVDTVSDFGGVVIVGNGSGNAITTGDGSTILGEGAGTAITTGDAIIIGQGAGIGLTTGVDNIAIGRNSSQYTQTGNNNVVIGEQCARGVSGQTNTFARGVYIGYRAGYNSGLTAAVTTADIVAIGNNAAANATGNNTVALGQGTCLNVTGLENIGIGNDALNAISTILPMSGDNNIGIGSQAGNNISSGTDNIAMGDAALLGDGTAGVTGSHNICLGNLSGNDISTGSNNILLGNGTGDLINTGFQNICIGINTGNILLTGDSNTLIGTSANASTSSDQNSIALGNSAVGQGSNTAIIGNSSVTACYFYDATGWSVPSDIRDKTNVKAIDFGLDFINNLDIITYNFDPRDRYEDRDNSSHEKADELVSHGVKAQQVEKVSEELGIEFAGLREMGEDSLAIGYTAFIPVLMKAVQELTNKVEKLEKDLVEERRSKWQEH